mmetsp:Transcript_9305/g.30237  ORF Transcript_9305/g.30237 Transcript_9305/m.30237 type:complete len:280 (-) Transcript_9305:277-1116(-)
MFSRSIHQPVRVSSRSHFSSFFSRFRGFLEEVAAGGVGAVVEDGGGAADGDFLWVSVAADAVGVVVVDGAVGFCLAFEAYVAVLSPGGSPGVADGPVVEARLEVVAVADEDDGVVDVGAASVGGEDAFFVEGPRGVDGDGDGADGGDGFEEGFVFVLGEDDEARHVRHGGRGLGALAVDASVRPVGFEIQAAVRGRRERDFRGGALAAAGAAALVGVRRAVDEFLRGQRQQGPRLHGDVRLHHLRRRERPAAPARRLILHLRHDPRLVTPVEARRKGRL